MGGGLNNLLAYGEQLPPGGGVSYAPIIYTTSDTTTQVRGTNNEYIFKNGDIIDAKKVFGSDAELINRNQTTGLIIYKNIGDKPATFVGDVFTDVSLNSGWNFNTDSGNSDIVDPTKGTVTLIERDGDPSEKYINVKAALSKNIDGKQQVQRIVYCDASGSFSGGEVLVDSVSGGTHGLTVPTIAATINSTKVSSISADYAGGQTKITYA